jgi:hypothetical protein
MDGGRVVASIDQRLGDIHRAHAVVEQAARDTDEPVRTGIARHGFAGRWAVGEGISGANSVGEVVGTEHGGFRYVPQPFGAQRAEIAISADEHRELA